MQDEEQYQSGSTCEEPDFRRPDQRGSLQDRLHQDDPGGGSDAGEDSGAEAEDEIARAEVTSILLTCGYGNSGDDQRDATDLQPRQGFAEEDHRHQDHSRAVETVDDRTEPSAELVQAVEINRISDGQAEQTTNDQSDQIGAGRGEPERRSDQQGSRNEERKRQNVLKEAERDDVDVLAALLEQDHRERPDQRGQEGEESAGVLMEQAPARLDGLPPD